MLYQKSATSIDEQLTLLNQRGMDWADEDLVQRWLITVGYYRLSAYWLPYELPADSGKTRSKTFKPGTRFEDVIDDYTFDRKLRLLVTEAIERIEIALRSRWTHRFSSEYGPHAHMDPTLFANGWKHADRIAAMANRAGQSREVFIAHYKNKYTEPYMPPLWAATELMTFGDLSKWVAATRNLSLGSAIASDLGLPTREILEGVIQALTYVRNICAHHGRLWNRRMVKRIPNIKRFRKDLVVHSHGNQTQPENLIYNVLVVLNKMLVHQSEDTTFPQRVRTLVNTRTNEQRRSMGFPDDWQDRPTWSKTAT